MKQHISHVAVVVPDYDEATAFYVGQLGFSLVEDAARSAEKRWVVVAPPGSHETRLLLAKASSDHQESRIGDQTGGRVFMFLSTDDFDRDHARMLNLDIVFLKEPRTEQYGKVAVFQDPFGNKWDLLQTGA